MRQSAIDEVYEQARADLERLRAQESGLDVELAQVRSAMKRAFDLLRAAEAYRSGDPVPADAVADFMPRGAEPTESDDPLLKLARSGYGAATQGVIALLVRFEEGMASRDLIDAIGRANFDVRSPETAVRSALKNLRERKEVEFVESTSRYRLTEHGRSVRR